MLVDNQSHFECSCCRPFGRVRGVSDDLALNFGVKDVRKFGKTRRVA